MPIRCLIVEDEFFTRDVLSLTLQRANLEVDLVESGQAALDYLYHNTPDVIILDLHMPNVNGYEVLHKIRHDSGLKHLIIIVITANPSAANHPDVQKADAFLTKPLNIKKMIDLIHQLVGAKN